MIPRSNYEHYIHKCISISIISQSMETSYFSPSHTEINSEIFLETNIESAIEHLYTHTGILILTYFVF